MLLIHNAALRAQFLRNVYNISPDSLPLFYLLHPLPWPLSTLKSSVRPWLISQPHIKLDYLLFDSLLSTYTSFRPVVFIRTWYLQSSPSLAAPPCSFQLRHTYIQNAYLRYAESRESLGQSLLVNIRSSYQDSKHRNSKHSTFSSVTCPDYCPY